MVTVHSIGGADVGVVLWCQVKVLETLQGDMRNVKPHIHMFFSCGHFLYKCKMQTGLRSHLVGVRGVDPGHLEHVFDLFSEANACSTVSSDVNAGDALSSSQLRRLEEQLILLRPKRTYHVGDVITDDDDVSTLWILQSLHLHLEGNHSHLIKSS